ncbi:lipoprotein signal peptidase [Kaistia sp. 32K]|uniref:signal peptidase II n=1 Tax=Kaistia sp. 32K TaxID=2795690 RepID=UPI00191538FC|nr:signal peptidase II [Kaistia sp. 32K]BCP56160.1 lipoprotein signal peptidase [Kaistia sp. 32K]
MKHETDIQAETARIPGPLSALGLSIIMLTVAIDQLSKWIADANLVYQQGIELVPNFLALYRVNNTGIAFSLGNSADSVILVILTSIVTLVILYVWRGSTEGGRLAAAGFALIVGGAIGNLIDRVWHGHVIDFLFLHWGARGFFVFNLADVALSIGPVLLAWVYLFHGSKKAG